MVFVIKNAELKTQLQIKNKLKFANRHPTKHAIVNIYKYVEFFIYFNLSFISLI